MIALNLSGLLDTLDSLDGLQTLHAVGGEFFDYFYFFSFSLSLSGTKATLHCVSVMFLG